MTSPVAPLSADSTAPRPVSPRLVVGSIAAVWLGYFVLASLRGWVVGLPLFDALLWRRGLVVLASIAVTAACWPGLRLLDSRPVWIKAVVVVAGAIPVALGLAAINQAVFAPVEGAVVAKIGEGGGVRIRHDEAGNLLVDAARGGGGVSIDADTRADNRQRQLTDVALGRYFVLAAWAALYFALVSAEQARAAERRAGELARVAKAAELKSLRYQVNPHFLFNTLNSLSALVLTGKPQQAEAMIQSLAGFYRHSLADEPGAEVALGDEIALQQRYLEIEAVRFPSRLETRIELPDSLATVPVPGMILQPLIENAVRHAVAPSRTPVTITIAAREEGGALVIEVRDTGAGAKGAAGFGIGLANVRDRLAARGGSGARLESGPAPGGGWISRIVLPLEDDRG